MGWRKKEEPVKQDSNEKTKLEQEIENLRKELQNTKIDAKQEIKNEVKSQDDEKFDSVLVVKELPTQEVRYLKDDNGKLIKLITIEEALTEIIKDS